MKWVNKPETMFLAVLLAMWVSQFIALAAFGPFADIPDVSSPVRYLGLFRWDAVWYERIAVHGYNFTPGQQSTVAFFPLYPMLIRALSLITYDAALAGVLISASSGLLFIRLFSMWSTRMGLPTRMCVAVALVYPFSFFIYGVVYSDALFLCLILSASLLIEKDRHLEAGLVGILVTACRPVGIAALFGLFAIALDRMKGKPRATLRASQVLIGILGLGFFGLFQWNRFGTPFAFLAAQTAWGNTTGWGAWLKFHFFDIVFGVPWGFKSTMFILHAGLTIVSVLLIARVRARLGRGYAVYCALVIAMPAIASPDFFGMGRYLLAAFPCAAVAAEMLARTPRWFYVAAITLSACTMLFLGALFGRGYYVS